MENKTEEKNIIEIKDVSLRYNKPSEKITTLKEFFVRFFKGKIRYDEFWVLNNINLEVKKGESLGLIGLNGSGKTTLLKVIAGILDATKGQVKISGSIAPLINLGAGFDMEASARENVFLNGAILGYSKKEMMNKYDSIVEFAELQDFMNVPLKNFSSGMLSRLGFAIAVDVNPDILLVDEILSVGDINFKQKCYAKIQEMLNNGTTLIFVSHAAAEVKKLCKKAMWIKDNTCYMYGDSAEVVDKYTEYCKELRDRAADPMKYKKTLDNSKIVPVVYATDNNYADITAVSFESLQTNASDDYKYKVFVLHDDEFSDESKEKFKAKKNNVTIEFVNIVSKVNKKSLYSKAHFSRAMYYRWLASEILDEYEKIVYLDGDTIVNSDIAELLRFDLKGHAVGAVRNVLSIDDPMRHYIEKILELDADKYINSGVQLIDTLKYKQNKVKEKCFHKINTNKAFTCPDQDAINIIINGDFEFLPFEWNYQCGNEEMLKMDIEKKKIIHYTDSIKPWNSKDCHLADEFWKYEKQTDLKIEMKSPPKKKSKFWRIVFNPFRLTIKFFKTWKNFGFKKAVYMTKKKIKRGN